MRSLRAKLIFYPGSGQSGDSAQKLFSILSEMEKQNILPEVFIVQPESQVEQAVKRAIKSGIKLIVAAGGDGTIDSVAGAMVESQATLGIIPMGTRNNVAFNLGIDEDIPHSVALLRRGRRIRIDVGRVYYGHSRQWFLEGVALGLISDLYPMADDFQHGDLTQIGGILSTFISATPSELQVILDGHRKFGTTTHMMLITNMPYLGPHFQISPDVSFKDSRLDVFTFSDMDKLSMLTYAVLSGGGLVQEAGTKHFRVKEAKIVSNPEMPVVADGVLLAEDDIRSRSSAGLEGDGR